MAQLPKSLENAIAQAIEATQTALADGYTLLQVELLFPELKPMPVAEQFLPALDSFGTQLKVFFPDAGAAALARRDWGDVPFKIMDIGTGRVPVERQILPEDEAFLLVSPTAVEVNQVEKMYQEASSRPFVLLNPRLEEVAIVGVGYAGRQLQARFLNKIESCYYLRPLEGAALFRCYPGAWQVWQEKPEDYVLIAELPQKPGIEEIDRILAGTTTRTEQTTDAPQEKPGIFASMQRFLRTLKR